jgi:cysteine-rich repeat protein
VAGYLEDLENCSATSSGTSEDGNDAELRVERRTPARPGTAPGRRRGLGDDGHEHGTTDASGTTTGTETTESSTGEPMAVCGNGVLEAFGPVPEECDDGNLDPDDGCSDTCALDRRVFVTSVLYNGRFESLKHQPTRCARTLPTTRAGRMRLKYRAWLSDSTTDARDRFKRGAVGW